MIALSSSLIDALRLRLRACSSKLSKIQKHNKLHDLTGAMIDANLNEFSDTLSARA